MKHYNLKTTLAIALLIMATMALNAATFDVNTALQNLHKAKPVRQFRGETPWSIVSSHSYGSESKLNSRHASEYAPNTSFNELSYFDYLTAADGSTWFYTTEYDITKDVISEWYTEEYITGFTFTIYDPLFNLVGQIKDTITLAEGETRVAHCVLDPSISANFFNQDNNYEVMVYLALNTSSLFDYEVHYYNKVYSIGGEKDDKGNDKCLLTLNGRCVDMFNASTTPGVEDCYYTFVDDIYPNMDDYELDDFLSYVNDAKTEITIYGKSTDNKTVTTVFTYNIFLTRYPGDTTDGIYMITKSLNGTPYFIFSFYEKPYFVDPTGMATDESATKDNHFLIDVYKYDGTVAHVSTTSIPVEYIEDANEVHYVFYSIGSVAWRDDIDFTYNGTPDAPAFLVARDYTTAANLEEVASSYDIYGNDGKIINNLVKNSESITLLGDIEGKQPQVMLVNLDDNEQYIFSFIDLYSCQTVFTIDQYNDGDPLTASCQRVADKDGNCKYVFEMTYDTTDEEGNDIKRMTWLHSDGSFDRIDYINMGKDVMYASTNMYQNALSPYLFDTDDEMEYAVLIRREYGGTTRNEFIVSDNTGDNYAIFSADDGKGAPYYFSIISGDINLLQMVYITDDNTYNMDIYQLPFGLSDTKVDNLSSNDSSVFTFEDNTIKAPNTYIEVYTLTGTVVATGNDELNLQRLDSNVYIVLAHDRHGNSFATKITL